MGDALLRKASTNSAEMEKTSSLLENSPAITYSTIKSYEGNNEGHTGLLFYDCYSQIKKRLFPQHLKAEAKAQVKLALGIYAKTFFGFFMRMTLIFMIGHKGKIQLASLGLGSSICNMTGRVYVIGITSVCETFFSQAYGAKQMRRYGIILQRAAIITSIAVLPSCALWINVDKILLHLGQDKEVAILAGQYTMWFIPGIFFFLLYQLLLRYLACQNVVYPSAYGAFAAFIVNGICCYVFIYVCDLGIVGSALAVDISNLTYSIVLLIFIFWKKLYKDAWYGWSYECFCEWKPFVSLSVSSTISFICEWTFFEIGILALGVIGSLEQAVQVVLKSLANFIYFETFKAGFDETLRSTLAEAIEFVFYKRKHIIGVRSTTSLWLLGSLGFAIAAAVRVGHFIGSGEPDRAKFSMRVALTLAAVSSICVGLLIISLQDVIVYVFTSDRSVVNMTSKLVYLVAIIAAFDGLEVVSMGVVRGLGYQKYGAIITFVAFLCIGVSSCLLLIFIAHLKVPGFWIGASIGIALQTVALFVMLFKIDWKKVSASVRENVGVVESTSDGCESQLVDNEVKGNRINLNSCNSAQCIANVECPSSDSKFEDVCLIAETSLGTEPDMSSSVSSSQGKSEEDVCRTTEDASPHTNQASEADVFFVHQPPHLSKLDIFIKVSVVLFLLGGVATSAVVRIYL